MKIRTNKLIASEQGLSSLMAVFSLTLLMVIVGGIASVTIANSYENKNNKDNMQAQYAAEAGLKRALVCFYNNLSFEWLSEKNYSLVNNDKAKYEIHITDENGNPLNDELRTGIVKGKKYYITSYGFLDEQKNKKKTVSAIFQLDSNGDTGGDINESEIIKGKIALYSDTEIAFSNTFSLINGTVIAANGSIGSAWWTQQHDPVQILFNHKIDIDFDNYPIFNWNSAIKYEENNVAVYLNDYFKEIDVFNTTEPMNKAIISFPIKNDLEGIIVSNNGQLGNLRSWENIILKNKVIKADAIDGKDITIENCRVIANSIKAYGNVNISKSIIEVKSFESSTGGNLLTMTDSRLNAESEIILGKSSINNCIITSNDKITTRGGKIVIDYGILSAASNLKISNGFEFDNVFVQAKGITTSTEAKLYHSLISSIDDISFGNGTTAFEESLILAKNNINFAGTKPQKITKSFVKTFNGEIHFGNTVELKGIILAKGLIRPHQGYDSFEYNDESLSIHLNLPNLITSGSNILNKFESFLGLRSGSFIQWGTEDYSKGGR